MIILTASVSTGISHIKYTKLVNIKYDRYDKKHKTGFVILLSKKAVTNLCTIAMLKQFVIRYAHVYKSNFIISLSIFQHKLNFKNFFPSVIRNRYLSPISHNNHIYLKTFDKSVINKITSMWHKKSSIL